MYIAFIPVKNGQPQEPKIEWCETCEAHLFKGEHRIGVYATKDKAIKEAHKYWIDVTCEREGQVVWCYEE